MTILHLCTKGFKMTEPMEALREMSVTHNAGSFGNLRGKLYIPTWFPSSIHDALPSLKFSH